MLDSHCHLADEAFGDDLPAVVERARAAGIQRVLCILAAGNADERGRAEVLQAIWPEVRFACGVHPHQAGDWAGRETEVAALVRAEVEGDEATCVVGEIGLDYHYDFAPRGVQRRVFAAQVELAVSLGLPVAVHTREAEAETWEILGEAGGRSLRGILHCFTGDLAAAEAALALGLHISFSGIVTFPRAGGLREVVASVPADRLLVETDAPYLAPVPHRGRRNEPAWVMPVLETVAEARGNTVAEVARAVVENFSTLVGPALVKPCL